MAERKKIAIYVDYSLRIPSFKEAYETFKRSLFKDDSNIEFEDELSINDPRFYWQRETSNDEVLKFYMNQNLDKIDNIKILGKFENFFYKDEHYKKFLEEYSFNLYADCQIPSQKDINILNITQGQLFDVTLIDKYENTRKLTNTFFFLSKIRIFPQTVIFLSPLQSLNQDNYIGIWNPMENPDQKNSDDSIEFLEWMKELEKKYVSETV